MKKLFAVIMAAAMIASVFVFTANGAENEWEVYASAGKYKDHYDEESDMPKEPGLRYTENGVQMYSATTDELDAMGANAWGGLQLKEKVNLSEGFTMTAVLDKYTDKAVDKWIAFCIWTEPKATPGDAEHGKGWFSLCRPGDTYVELQSFIDTPANVKAIGQRTDTNIYEGEALVLDVRKVDGKLSIFINDVDMNASEVFDKFENNEAYVSIALHQGNHDEISVTVTDVNGVKPTGTDSKEPFIPSDAKPRVEGPEVEANKPCWLYTSEDVKDGKPGSGMTSIVNDDGSIHCTVTGDNQVLMTESVKDYIYDAEQFPVWACKFKGLDEIYDSAGLWYCAGDVFAAQNDSMTTISWYDAEELGDGWMVLAVDLTGENRWEGAINSFRLDIDATQDNGGEEFDIAWIGFFRSEEEAYTYAGLKKTETTAEEDVTTEADVQTTDDETKANDDTQANDTAEPTTTTASDVTTKEPATTGNTDSTGGLPTAAIIGIICGVVVIAVVVVIIIVTTKKKKA